MEGLVQPGSVEEWHQILSDTIDAGFLYYIHLSVRAFFFDRFCCSFVLDHNQPSSSCSSSLTHEFRDLFSLGDNKDHNIFTFIESCCSLRLPSIAGYWRVQDYEVYLLSYLHWLKTQVYPRLGISRQNYEYTLSKQLHMFSKLLIRNSTT